MNLSKLAQSTTDLNDYCQDQALTNYQVLQLPMLSFGLIECFYGKARTLSTCEDSALAKQLYQQDGHGCVAVIDGGGSTRTALLGDINANILINNNWSGIIINGAVRDVATLSQLKIGIKAIAVTPTRSAKNGIGTIDIPVAFGCCYIEPGDYIYADTDGVLISKTPLNMTR